MEGAAVLLGKSEALALHGLHVQHHGAIEFLGLIEHIDQGLDVMAVDGSNRDQVEMLKPAVGVHFMRQILRDFTQAVVDLRQRAATGHVLGKFAGGLLKLTVTLAQAHMIKVRSDRALWLSDRHAVVIEHHQELTVQGAGVVQTFHRHTVHDAGVANHHRNAATIGVVGTPALTTERIAARYTNSSGDTGTGMTNREEIEV